MAIAAIDRRAACGLPNQIDWVGALKVIIAGGGKLAEFPAQMLDPTVIIGSGGLCRM